MAENLTPIDKELYGQIQVQNESRYLLPFKGRTMLEICERLDSVEVPGVNIDRHDVTPQSDSSHWYWQVHIRPNIIIDPPQEAQIRGIIGEDINIEFIMPREDAK